MVLAWCPALAILLLKTFNIFDLRKFKFLNLSSVDAKLVFHPVVSTNGINRKQLAETSRNQVIKGIQLIQSQNHY